MLRDCLSSIPPACTRTPSEVWLVDNASTDGSRELVRAAFPAVKLIEVGERRGYSANQNLAQSRSRAPFLCLLNNDTILRPRALDALVEFLRAHHEVGIAGPMVWNLDGTPQASCGAFVSLRGELLANCLPSRWLPRPVAHSKIEDRGSRIEDARIEDRLPLRFAIRDPQSSICYPDWLVGACLVLRREVWDELGGFDEQSFFLYFEETDLCKRAANAGWRVAHVLSAEIVHLRGRTTSQHEKSVVYMRSQLRYFRKHMPRWQEFLLRVVTALSFALRAVAWGLLGRRQQAAVFAEGLRVQLRGP